MKIDVEKLLIANNCLSMIDIPDNVTTRLNITYKCIYHDVVYTKPLCDLKRNRFCKLCNNGYPSLIHIIESCNSKFSNIQFISISDIGTQNEVMTINCNIHGNINTKYYRFLKNRLGCPSCSKSTNPNRDYIKFVDSVSEILSLYKYTIIDIVNPREVYINDDLGILYKTSFRSLLKCNELMINSAVDKTDYLIKKSKFQHNNGYSYEYTKYIDSKTKVTVRCTLHDKIISIYPYELLNHNWNSCPDCYNLGIIRSKRNDYITSNYIKYVNEYGKTDSILYIIRCYNDKESFIKIGVTSHWIEYRYRDKKKLPYDYEVIEEIYGTSMQVYMMEKELHMYYKDYSIIPNIKFKGWTECFSDKILAKSMK